LIIFNSKKEY